MSAFSPRRLTDLSAQLAAFTIGRPEVISWKSQDGTLIEGVLVRPADFDPSRRYPLLVQIHGGPTGIDRPIPFGLRYYPTDIWLGRGALLLKVNYRGSAGYGQRFRQLNLRNLGVGDAWDVVSGIEALVARGVGGRVARRLHGMEPGWLHLRVPHHLDDEMRGGIGGRRDLELGDLLLQHRHHAVHDPVSRRRSGRRSRDLPQDVADDVHQTGEDPHPHPARRKRSTRARSPTATSCGRGSRIAGSRSR